VGALEGWDMGRNVLFSWGRVWGGGIAPLSRKFFDFWHENDVFWCILALFLVTE